MKLEYFDLYDQSSKEKRKKVENHILSVNALSETITIIPFNRALEISKFSYHLIITKDCSETHIYVL